MTSRFTLLVSLSIVASAFAAVPASAGHHCVRLSAGAVGITKDVATLLAKEAVYQSIVLQGRTARGAADVSCKYVGIVTDCTARQAACK
jgi:hypothetical protein